VTPAPGAGHGGEGDASPQGPAQDGRHFAQNALPQSEQPKPTHPEEPADADASAARPPIEAAGEPRRPEVTGENCAVVSLPAPRKAKTADVTVTRIPKPAKRKNARQRAKEKMTGKPAEDATTPDTTAKAKSKAGLKKAAGKAGKRRVAAGKAA
jgi:hypothetical protein